MVKAKVLGDLVLLFDNDGNYVGHLEGKVTDVGVTLEDGERLYWLSSKSGEPLGMLWLEDFQECKDIREAIPNGTGNHVENA